MTATRSTKPALDAAAFVATAERITNKANLPELLSLYHPDATADWTIDGVREHHEGIDQISWAATVLTNVWRENQFHIDKTLVCADSNTIVLSWEGGFRGDTSQAGTEIWKLRDGLVIRHEINGYLHIRSAASLLGQTRILASSPRFAASILRNQRRARRRRAN